jgi:hypothetical protein
MAEGTLVLAASLSALGCGFSDRRAEAWSDSNGAEGVSADEYGVAVAGVTTDLPGATIVGLGLDPVGLSVIRYDETGALVLSGADLPELANATLPEPPTLIAAPEPVPGASGLVALGGLGELDQILFYDASSGTPRAVGAVSGADCGAPGENLGHAMALGFTSAGVANQIDLVALRGDEVFLFPDLDLDADAHTCFRCQMPQDGLAMALIEIGLTAGDEIMVAAGGALIVFNAFQVEEAAEAEAGCFDIRSPQISGLTSPGLEGDFGARLAVGEAPNGGAVVAGTAPSAGAVYVVPTLSDSGPGGMLQALAAPLDSGAFGDGPVVFLDIDGDDLDELVIGDPGASPGGVSGAGQASVFAFSEDEDYELRGVLFDSTPEADQEFGRSLSLAEFVFDDDLDLLVAGASGEVFTYFRVFASALDPRQ